MPLIVGLNGFGRIGRIILRTCFVKSNIEIVAINDPAVIDIDYICYLLKFDSTHGKFSKEISHSDGEIIISGKKIKVFHEKSPSCIPWHMLGVEYVVEASGMFSSMDKASGHLISTSVKCVLVTAPSVDIPMLILGVNEHLIKKDQRVISCASSTLYCLAPIVKVLEDNFGISKGFVTCIHAMTPSLKPLDGLCLKGRYWRDHRSIHQNIIPATTGACKALGKIIPTVNDKFCGLAFRVPIVNVSVLDITVSLKTSTSIQEIAALIEEERKGKMKNIISTSYDEAVSSDFMNDENSCILDVNSSLELTPKSFKLICWYENEYSYACRVIDTIFSLQERFKSPVTTKCSVLIEPRSDTACEAMKKRNVIKKHKSNKIFNTMSLGSDLNEHLNTNILNFLLTNPQDKRSGDDVDINVNEEIIKITAYDDRSNENVANESDIPSTNITANRERLSLAKKELAKIASKTDDLLKYTNIERTKVDEFVFKPSTSHNRTNFFQDNYQETLVDLHNEENNRNSIDGMNHSDTFLKNLSEIKTNNVQEADNHKQSHATYKNGIEEIIEKEEIIEVKSKIKISCLHDIEASIIISDRDGKENTIVSISGKPNRNTLANNNMNRASRSNEYFNYDKSGRNMSKEDVVLPLELRNKRFNTMNNKKITNDQHEIKSENRTNKNTNILVSSGSFDSKRLLKWDPDDFNHISQMSEPIENADEIIKKKILSSVLKTSKNDAQHLPMLGSCKQINKRECLAKENILLEKLASEADSDFSFRMDETKSQVIEITDLFSSTEDLARLDKICRIIEISDELSDELFSALSISSETGKKEWSFKELCEKIKLDEFCTKVFGQ